MTAYRCYFLDGRGKISDWKIIESSDDGSAQEMAVAKFHELSHHHAVEMWHLARRVFIQMRDAA
jgi:hypothetical protein